MTYPCRLLDDIDTLASFSGWSRWVDGDFFRLRAGGITECEFRNKYCRQTAILTIDMTGFTLSAYAVRELNSLTRIFDAQRVALPVLQDRGADLIRCSADDIVALFRDPWTTIHAALDIHDEYNNSMPHELLRRTPRFAARASVSATCSPSARISPRETR
jgi:hypothetical protein